MTVRPPSAPRGPGVRATQLRDFDYKTNSVTWSGIGGAGSTPRQSRIRSTSGRSRAFFGSGTWPWVDPTGTTKVYTLPAKARYEAGRPNG